MTFLQRATTSFHSVHFFDFGWRLEFFFFAFWWRVKFQIRRKYIKTVNVLFQHWKQEWSKELGGRKYCWRIWLLRKWTEMLPLDIILPCFSHLTRRSDPGALGVTTQFFQPFETSSGHTSYAQPLNLSRFARWTLTMSTYSLPWGDSFSTVNAALVLLCHQEGVAGRFRFLGFSTVHDKTIQHITRVFIVIFGTGLYLYRNRGPGNGK